MRKNKKEVEKMTLKNIKTLLGITGDEQDELLTTIQTLVASQLSYLLEVEKVPSELAFIVTEVSIIRYNRRKNEGMTSYSQEGESISYVKSDFEAYMAIINQYKGKARTGEVWGY